NKDNGSIAHYPLEKTTYVLKLHSLWRTQEAEVTVEVDTYENFVVTRDKGTVVAGEPVTVSWDMDLLVPGTPHVDALLPLMVEVDDAPYSSIAATGEDIPFSGSTADRRMPVEFPAGFTFPFYGEEYTKVYVSNLGYLTFDEVEGS